MRHDSSIFIPWTLDPVLIGMLLTAGLIYWLLAGPLRERLTRDGRVTPAQAIMFYSALVVAFFTEASPLHDLSEKYLFSAHMAQHLLLSYAVAPLILAGLPGWMVRPFVANKAVRPVFYVVTRAVPAFFIFNIATSLWHLPFVYESALGNPFVHHTQHIIFLALSLLLWWPIMSPVREIPRIGPGPQILYLLAMPLGQFFVAALLTFSQQSIYPTYEAANRFIPDMTPEADQQLGGVVMKIFSFIAFGVPLIVIFMKWLSGNFKDPTAPVERKEAAASQPS